MADIQGKTEKKSEKSTEVPIVYSCSGASTAAQVCNEVALRLDQSGLASMSCIAGVGGDVPALVSVAKSGRPIVALDGCHLQCVKKALDRHGLAPDIQINLAEHGIKKVLHQRFDPGQADEMFVMVQNAISSKAAK